ncbi:MAG: DUF3536 domain-containing protein [Candidatus Margulisbacteria bacterium]|nr:DUF3536 domain-containing protein [Candidatus Margulisiibacteriota bacterium]
MNKYICIHGHFYQPPRENPFLNKIERQDSAFPYHDWNEKINDECYRPNTSSRILSPHGKIVDIINNFQYLSFNVGPTLMNWIYDNDKSTYEKIVEADEISKENNNGHGNAIAQVYNHIIMPLANERDKQTQIKWGIADFKRHFGRDPEGMWLAETAINMETVKALIANGIKFTVLSPFQAEKVKTYFSNEWINVSNGTVDPTQPYRVFVDETKEKYLDVFFYDAPISTAISFEHLLKDAHTFAERLDAAAKPNQGRPTLVTASTDGESYGHHEPFGDMCLSYFFKHLAKEYNMKQINYGAFLERFAPISEAVLKEGTKHEGTAWSCVHGVGRWKENCGCSTGGGAGWNQEWRKPLREGLNALRDLLWETYEKEATPLLANIEKARNDYYFVFHGSWSSEKFFEKNAKGSLTDEQKVKILELLESQRFSQLMFTSCGWFFSEISGIETVQIIKYANAAIYYGQQHTKVDLEKVLIAYLKEAKSNINSAHDGDAIYKKWIKPYELTREKAINQFIVKAHLTNKIKEQEVYLYTVSPINDLTFKNEDTTFRALNCSIMNIYTGKTTEHSALLSEKNGQVKTSISKTILDLNSIKKELLDDPNNSTEIIKNNYQKTLSMIDLNFEESSDIMKILWSKKTNRLNKDLNKLYTGFRDLIEETVRMGGNLPTEIKSAIEIIMSAKLLSEIQEITSWNNKNIKPALRIIKLSHSLHLNLNVNETRAYLEKYLNSLISKIEKGKDPKDINIAISFLGIYEKLEIKFNRSSAETKAFLLHKADQNNTLLKELALMMNILV